MNKDKQLFDITEELSSRVKIKFNEYAIEKYGCSDLELQKFHTKYEQAVSFYRNKKEKENRLVMLCQP